MLFLTVLAAGVQITATMNSSLSMMRIPEQSCCLTPAENEAGLCEQRETRFFQTSFRWMKTGLHGSYTKAD